MKQKLLNSIRLRAMMLVAVLCTAFAGQAWADSETITMEEQGWSNQETVSSVSGTNITLAFTDGTTATAYYNTGRGVRIYGGGSMTVTAGGNLISSVACTFSAAGNAPSATDVWSSNGTGSGTSGVSATWTGSATEVVIERPSGSGHWRLQKVTVTYTAPGTTASPSISGDTPFLTSTTVTLTNAASADGADIYYTLNGENPTTTTSATCLKYSAPFELTETATVKAIAKKSTDTNASTVVSKTFTKVTPKTVAEANTAIAALGSNETIEDQYVLGIVSTVSTFNSGSLIYYISDDGTTTNQLQVYRGKGLNGANFSAATDLEVGDKVVVYGTLKNFNGTTPEFDQGSSLISLVEIADNDLTKKGDINLSMASPSTTADATDYFTTSSDGAITYSVYNSSVVSVSSVGVVAPVAAGSTTITVSQAKTADYKAGEITINVVVAAAELSDPTLILNASGNTVYGTPKVEDYAMNAFYDGTVAASSSNEAVATVAITQPTSGNGTFTVTPVAVGTAVITISAPLTAKFKTDEETYTITVTAPAGGEDAADTGATLWTETWDKTDGTGGNDGAWNGTIASSSVVEDQTGWSYANEGGASKCLKLGSSSKKGTATTPAFGTAGDITVKFKAAAWNGGSEQTDLILSLDGEGTLDKTSVSMTKGAFNNFEVTVTGAAADTKLVFAGKNNSNSRFFLDEVVVKTAGVNLSARLNASGYATYCSLYPLDFTDYATAGYSAWEVTDISESAGVYTITFNQLKGKIKGGQGILLKGTAGETVTIASCDSENTLGDNLLEGTTAPTYVTSGDYYGLSGENFVPVNTGTVKAGKALLDADWIPDPSLVKSFTFVFNDTATGITETRQATREEVEAIFNLGGQRMSKLQKGVNIVNGKKVLVK